MAAITSRQESIPSRLSNAVQEYFFGRAGWKDLTKGAQLCGKIAELAGRVLPPRCQAVCGAAKVVDKIIGVAEGPEKAKKLAGRVHVLSQAGSKQVLSAGVHVVLGACEVVSPVCAVAELLSEFKIIQLSDIAKVALKGIGSVALTIGAGYKAITNAAVLLKDLDAIAKKNGVELDNATKSFLGHFVEQAKWISLCALGIIGMVTIALPTLIAPWIPVALTVVGLACSVFGFFYGKMVLDPIEEEKKRRSAPVAPRSALPV